MTDETDKELKDQRVVTMMSPSELEAIDDWMFKNRIRSRGEAIRRLTRVGLVTSDHFIAIDSAIEDAIESNLAAVHRLEEDFVQPGFENWSREDSRKYANLVVDALEKLAELHGARDEMFGEVAILLNMQLPVATVMKQSEVWRSHVKKRLAEFDFPPPKDTPE